MRYGYTIYSQVLIKFKIREFFVYFLRNIAVVTQVLVTCNTFEIHLVCIIYFPERMTKLSLQYKMQYSILNSFSLLNIPIQKIVQS